MVNIPVISVITEITGIVDFGQGGELISMF
jgi:hypothetical protein